MKKFLSLLIFAVALFFVGSPASAGENEEVQKALDLIEKTNKDIDEKIKKAVQKADKLQSDYLYEIRKIEEGDKVLKLKEEKEKVISELDGAKNDMNKQEKLKEKLAELESKINDQQLKIEEKMNEINQEISEVTLQLVTEEDKDTKKLTEKLTKLSDKLNEKSAKSLEKSQKFTKDLDKVITDVYNETLEMSAKTIQKAAEKGVIAECSWKLVKFADRWVWIDPIRVVGC